MNEDPKQEIGKAVGPVFFEVDRHSCRLFARAVGYTDRVFYDVQTAQHRGYRDLLAPPGFLGHPAYDPDAPMAGSLRIAVDTDFDRVLNAGTEIEYFDDICAGDRLSATAVLSDVQEKTGRLGPMLLLEIEETYRLGDRIVATVRRQRILY